MGANSKIAWTHHTQNFWLGCNKVSEACRFCYAEKFVNRYHKNMWGINADRHVTTSTWNKPKAWDNKAKKEGVRYRVFVNSLSDFFEDNELVKDARERAWNIIRECKNIDWLLLTKRPQNIQKFLPEDWGSGWDNVWLGTSVACKKDVVFAKILTGIPAKVRWLSMEPLIEEVDVSAYLPNLHWVVVGGESGFKKDARSFDLQWAKNLRLICEQNNVKFFMKQLGVSPITTYKNKITMMLEPIKYTGMVSGDDKGDQLESFPEELRVRDFPTIAPF